MKNLKPYEVVCDAPPYPIVEACEHIHREDGTCVFENPKDTRWERISKEESKDFCEMHTPQTILGPLAGFRFTYSSGDEVTYEFTQCSYCKTIYWREKVQK